MALTVTHTKHNNVTDWTQAQLDAQIALGNFAPGTLLADIALPSDWNANHTIAGTLAHNTDLTGLQGGTTNEYYHLTSAQYTVVQNTSGTNTGDQTNITGNAGTATALQTARLIGNVSFNGIADITPQQIQPASETSDNTCFPLFVNAASGTAQQPKYNASFGFNASTNALSFAGLNLSGLTASKVVFTDSSKNLTSTGIGTSAQFIKGDGSLDGTVYGTGSVTSVTFTGDGTLLSSTPSSAVTTTGTLTATLANAGAKTVLGNPTGSSAAPVYTTAPVVSGLSTALNFNATATGAASSYFASGVNFYWNDDTNFNTSIGNNNLQNTVSQAGGGSNGTQNFAMGKNALTAVTIGSGNAAIGSNAGKAITTGTQNFALGPTTMALVTTGVNNTAVGTGSMGSTGVAASDNTIIGAAAGVIIDGNQNTFIGSATATLLGLFGTSSNNTIIGYRVASGASSFSNCILIGYDSTVAGPFFGSNVLNIGNAIQGTGLGGTPNIGIGSVSSPSARLQVPAGSATASTSPFKFTSGTNLTTPENGAVEYNGTDYFVTAQSARQKIIKGLSGSFSGTGTATTTFTVTFGGTQPNSTYRVFITPTAVLSAVVFYVNNKTSTTFDVVYLAGLTGTVTFDWEIIQ